MHTSNKLSRALSIENQTALKNDQKPNSILKAFTAKVTLLADSKTKLKNIEKGLGQIFYHRAELQLRKEALDRINRRKTNFITGAEGQFDDYYGDMAKPQSAIKMKWQT